MVDHVLSGVEEKEITEKRDPTIVNTTGIIESLLSCMDLWW